MRKSINSRRDHIMPVAILLLMVLFMMNSSLLHGQEPPPRPLEITVTPQSLAFGAFSIGATGGSVTVQPDGSRSSGGDVILLMLGFSYSACLLELVANPGTLISVLNGPDATLTGSGGGTMSLHLGSCSPASPFVMTTEPPDKTNFYIGGTLTVGNLAANPPGSYTGTFNITFIQE
jgi:hypothetical protein